MALPLNIPSSQPVLGEFLSPDDQPFSPYVVYEKGGVDLQDPSKGLQVYDWRCKYANGNIILERDQPFKQYILFQNIPSLKSIDFTFDQNMNQTLVLEESQNVTLYWYDASAGIFTTSVFTGIRDPRLTLDDKRLQSLNTSDIIFAYIKDNGDLAYRQQRDRFTIERVLSSGIPDDVTLLKIGMTNKQRMEFRISKKTFLPECEFPLNISESVGM